MTEIVRALRSDLGLLVPMQIVVPARNHILTTYNQSVRRWHKGRDK